MANRYLAWLYTKHFVIILSILQLFFILIDFLQNQKDLPDSINLTILYIYFESIAALKITLPLSLVFGAITLFVHLIRTNEIVALMSFGMSRQKIIKPIFLVSLSISLLFVLINTTSIGYFYENGQSLLKNRDRSSGTENLFFKFNDNYIYINKLNPLTQEVLHIKLFHIKNGNIDSITYAPSAKYSNDSWLLRDVKMISIPISMSIDTKPIAVTQKNKILTLDGFKPRVIDSVSNVNAALNISDMIEALFVLKNQDIDIERIRQMLFVTILVPIMAPVAIVIIFLFTPISVRFFDVTTFSSIAVFAVLACYGVFSALSKAKFSNIQLSFVMLFLSFALALFSYRVYTKKLQ